MRTATPMVVRAPTGPRRVQRTAPRRPVRARPSIGAVATNRAVQAGAVAIAALALCLVRLTSSYDIFIDEVTYTRIAANVADNRGLTLDNRPFDLHPPAFLTLLGAVVKVFGLHGGIEHQLLDLRPVSAVFGALGCAGAYLIVERAANQRYALVAAALLAISPFVILYNSEVMLEAPAQAAAVGLFGFLAAAAGATNDVSRRRLIVAAGVFGALVVCTKETFGLVAVAALLVVLATGWIMPRRQVAAVLGLTALGYAITILYVGQSSGFGTWAQDQFGGVLRLVGIDQETGFNAPTTHVSLLSRVFADGASDGATYLVLGMGVLASVELLIWLRPWQPAWRAYASPREQTGLLIVIWSLCATTYLAYATLFGSLEEQMFYIMVLPTVAALCVWASWTVATWRLPWRRMCVALLTVALIADCGVWVAVHTGNNDGYQQFLAWEPTHVPRSSVISVTEGTAQFLIQGSILNDWDTVAQLRANHVDYVLISTVLTDQGYGSASKSFETVLEQRATLLFQSKGGDGLRFYDVRALTGAAP